MLMSDHGVVERKEKCFVDVVKIRYNEELQC